MNDSVGKTWAGIVGDKAMESRVGATNAPVMIASIDGMTATAVHATQDFAGPFTDGQMIADANYKGIGGTAYCLAATCTVTDGKLEMGWFFTPESSTTVYVKRKTDDPATTDVDERKLYEAETLYAQFGHWLTVDATSGVVTVNRYAFIAQADTVATGSNLNYLNVEGMPTSATYTGDAAGMSAHKTVDTDGEITSIYSGAFTADAELILRFGDGVDITLGGTIDNFQTESDGMNVDSTWEVELERRAFTDGAFADNTTGKTITNSPGRNGEWSATAYGPPAVDGTNQRPTGIFGGFNAHFSDGHAAGVYATR